MGERFDAWELRRLELAEELCPWGPSAENARMVYLADVIAAYQCGKKEDAAKCISRANAIAERLFGSAPRRKVTVAELKERYGR